MLKLLSDLSRESECDADSYNHQMYFPSGPHLLVMERRDYQLLAHHASGYLGTRGDRPLL